MVASHPSVDATFIPCRREWDWQQPQSHRQQQLHLFFSPEGLVSLSPKYYLVKTSFGRVSDTLSVLPVISNIIVAHHGF
jgi:hypothetical protein